MKKAFQPKRVAAHGFSKHFSSPQQGVAEAIHHLKIPNLETHESLGSISSIHENLWRCISYVSPKASSGVLFIPNSPGVVLGPDHFHHCESQAFGDLEEVQ